MSKALGKRKVGTGREAVRSALAHRGCQRIPRGEIWLGRGVFQDLGWEDSLEARLRLCFETGMDMVFLPVGVCGSFQSGLNYRCFTLGDVTEVLRADSGLFVGVVFDGPFQRLSDKMGLLPMVASLRTGSITNGLGQEALRIAEVVSDCAKLKPDAIVIADDIAHSHATFANPQNLIHNLFPHYSTIVQCAQAAGVRALFHSDGDISEVIADLISCGFNGLAACEFGCQELLALKQRYGARLSFITGVPAEWLEAERLESCWHDQFTKAAAAMAQRGGFVLCSSSGLSSKKHLDNLKTLYRWADTRDRT